MATSLKYFLKHLRRLQNANALLKMGVNTGGHAHACGISSSCVHSVKEQSKTTDLMSAMISAAQERRTAYDALIQKEQEDYTRGCRHLANMMGEDPEIFTQADVNASIRYLFPSGLTEKKARPLMHPPTDVFPPQKAAQFASDGRPFDALFYTGKPNYYNLMHETHAELNKVISIENTNIKKGIMEPSVEKIDLDRSEWIDKKAVELMIVEEISDADYKRFITLLERILQHPYAKQSEECILKFRRELVAVLSKKAVEPLKYTQSGRAYTKAKGSRKEAEAMVILFDQGSGQVIINGHRFLDYFHLVQHRIQIMFPLHFVGMVNRFDLRCHVRGGGSSGQSGAIRLAIARALCSFVDQDTVEKLRQAGLLTRDPRMKERKKPGQKGARKKFTWKKR